MIAQQELVLFAADQDSNPWYHIWALEHRARS